MNKCFFNKEEAHQHFSLRKLSVGVASVLLGTTFMVFGSQSVKADELTQPGTEHVQNQNDSIRNIKNASDIVTETKAVSNEDQVSNTATTKVEKDANNVITTSNKDTVITNVSSKDTTEPSNAPVTREDVIDLFGLNKKDISAEDLAKLGLKENEFYNKGIKYHVTGTVVVTDNNTGKKFDFDNIKVLHNADGTYHNSNDDVDDDLQIIYDVNSLIHYSLMPVVEGNTIYVNKGSQLTSNDAKRGVDTDNPEVDIKSAVEFKWDNNDPEHVVDINKAGIYDGMIDIYYELGQGIDQGAVKVATAVGVKVTIVDLSGKDIWVHINGDVPSAEESVNGAPAGSTDYTWNQKPTTSTPGTSTGTVTVTYPDGTKGTTAVTVHVIAPQVPPTVTIDKGSKIPDPETEVKNAQEIKDHITGDTTYTWNPDIKIDTNTPGETSTEIITHWPDGTTTTSPIKVIVKDITDKDVIIAETTLNRKVEFVDINDHAYQLADPVISSVTFKLHKITDENGKVSYVWTPEEGTFPSVPAKNISGWVVDDQSRNGAPAEAVTADDLPKVESEKDLAKVQSSFTITTKLYYHKENEGPVDPGTPDTPDTPDTPVKPETPTTPDKPTIDDNVTPLPIKPEKPTTSNKKTSVKRNNGPVGPAENTGLGSSNEHALAAANKTAKRATLPQTGSKQNGILAAVGAAVAAIGGLFGLASRKKRS